MKVLDLAQAIAPDCEVKYIGIRPGEKLHETLISEHEARHTLELDDFYIIQPMHPWWRVENWTGAKPLGEGFSYTSDTNERWLSAQGLLDLLE